MATIKRELKDANEGRFAERTACILLSPYGHLAKQYRSVRRIVLLANTGVIALHDVHVNIRPQYKRLWTNLTEECGCLDFVPCHNFCVGCDRYILLPVRL